MAKEILAGDLPAVGSLVQKVLHADSYAHIERMGGLTNHTYAVTLHSGERYVVRLPGEGTEEMIVRKDEQVSTELACSVGIDAELLYFGPDGSKVSRYIDGAVTMSAATMKEPAHIWQAAAVFKTLHTCGKDTGVPFEVFDMAGNYETIIRKNHVPMYEDYAAVKTQVMQIKAEIDAAVNAAKVPCHNDPLCENWVTGADGKMYLIDWEYAGMNDGMWDLADVSIEAGYDKECDRMLLCEYLGREPDKGDWRHFYASKIYVDYLWTLWAKTRVPFDGQPMEDWAAERYARLKGNLEQFAGIA